MLYPPSGDGGTECLGTTSSNVSPVSLSQGKQSSVNRKQPKQVFVQAVPPSFSQTQSSPALAQVAPPAQPAPAQLAPAQLAPAQPVPAYQPAPQPQQQQFQNPAPVPTAPVVPANPPPIGSTTSKYAFHSYRLSFMQSDRVLALLKALGYSTVEFSVGRGESLNESIFTAFKDVERYPLVVKILERPNSDDTMMAELWTQPRRTKIIRDGR